MAFLKRLLLLIIYSPGVEFATGLPEEIEAVDEAGSGQRDTGSEMDKKDGDSTE